MTMVLDALDRLGIEYDVQRDEAFARCPQHKERVGKEDSSPSWSINVDTGLHNCFSCGYAGNLPTLVLDVQGFAQVSQAKEWIDAGEVDASAVVRKVRNSKIRRALVKPQEPFDVSRYLALSPVTQEFARTRSLRADFCNDFGLRQVGDDTWVIPILNEAGTLLGWQEKGPGVFRNVPTGVRKGLCLFGLSFTNEYEIPVVVESPLDAVLAWQHGVPAVATFGAVVTDQQVKILARFPSVILAFDNDEAGKRATDSVSERLSALDMPWHRVTKWPENIKDYGDAPDRVTEFVAAAVPVIQMRLS